MRGNLHSCHCEERSDEAIQRLESTGLLRRAKSALLAKTAKLFFIAFLFSIFLPAFSAQDAYPFTTIKEATRFQTLTTQLRCLVCQNQTLAESEAPLADDLRRQIYNKMLSGQSDPQIVAYLTARYGNFILYRPPFVPTTLFLWLGPAIFLCLASSGLLYFIRQRKK
jgi:cytochrome c-type biogenesis protein CcmH